MSSAAPITVIAYGSLMSGYGLTRLGPLPVLDAYRVTLRHGRRGFGKLSQYGDRYAMVLEALDHHQPIAAEQSDNAAAANAMAFTVNAADFARIASREGYVAAERLIERAADQPLAAYLWDMLAARGGDTAAYRSALWQALGYTSPHYIPHPVPLRGEGVATHAIVFLAPGAEGSGCDEVMPVRVQSGMTELLSLAEAWQHKANDSQLQYFTMCLLAETHGVSLADVRDGHTGNPDLSSLLAALIKAEEPHEVARFQQTLAISDELYHRRFRRRA